MATEVTRNLYIDYDNAKTYLTANGVSLQINIAGTKVAVRHYMNGGKTGYATINSAGMDVLFPSDTAIPHKLDLGSHIGQLVSSSKNWVEFRIDGTALERFPGGTGAFTRTYTNETVSAFRKNSTFMGYHNAPNTVNGTSYRYLNLTLYFTQYSCSANAVGNGIQSASVSNSAPYEGDTVTFTPKLVNGATWDGWYSDASCAQLVSTEQNYTTSAADLTLYAKATIAATVYNCSAVAGENITSVSVSDESVVSGDSATFTAQLNEHCTFDGWFSDSSYTTLISTANPYTATITSDTTLYAKGTKISYSVSVGTAEHGTATVSANTAHYGDSVTFTFTPEDETWQLYGWYSDVGLSQLVSEDNPYTFTVTEDVMLYPKVGIKRYTITVGQYKNILTGTNLDFDVISFYYDRLTKEEVRLLRTGEFDNIDQSKVIEKKSASGSSLSSDVIATILCPFNAYIAIYAKPTKLLGDTCFGWIQDGDGNNLTNWPYYWCQPSKDAFFKILNDNEIYSCNCSAIAKDGIDYAYATTPTRQGYNAIFEAEISPGYAFSGWYSDELCTQLVSSDNPVYVTTPKHNPGTADITSLTLYAKATKINTGTGLYVKSNGTYAEVQHVYKKINGIYVEQTDIASIMDTNTKYINMN